MCSYPCELPELQHGTGLRSCRILVGKRLGATAKPAPLAAWEACRYAQASYTSQQHTTGGIQSMLSGSMLGMIRAVGHRSLGLSLLGAEAQEYHLLQPLKASVCFISTAGVHAADGSSGSTRSPAADITEPAGAQHSSETVSTDVSVGHADNAEAAAAPTSAGSGQQPPPKEDLVKQFFSGANMNKKQRFQQEKEELVRSFRQHITDTASPEVMIAVWTHWIRERVKDFHIRPKQPHALRELEMTMHKRRRLLSHLRDMDFKAYTVCIHKLGLADVFGFSTSADRYPVGKAHGDPAGAADHVRRRIFSFHTEYGQKKTSQWKRLLPQLQFQDPNLPTPPSRMIPGSVQRL